MNFDEGTLLLLLAVCICQTVILCKFRHTQAPNQGVGTRPELLFFRKFKKIVLTLENRALIVPILGFSFLLKCSFKNIQENKLQNFSLRPIFVDISTKCLSKWPNSTKPTPPCKISGCAPDITPSFQSTNFTAVNQAF